MTAFEWVMVSLGAAGFVITWTSGVIGITSAVENIKSDTSKKITASHDLLSSSLTALRDDFHRDQKAQDHNYGEVASAMRQYTANVEKEMHEIEIWGRDNFVLKDDFVKATDKLSDIIKDMANDIKSDFRDLNAKIDAKH
jgi:hypothetical protein